MEVSCGRFSRPNMKMCPQHALSYVIIPDKLSHLLKFFRPEIPLVQIFPYPGAPLCKGFNQIKSPLGKLDIFK